MSENDKPAVGPTRGYRKYPAEIRAAAIAAVVANGGNVSAAAKKMGLCKKTVHVWWVAAGDDAKAAALESVKAQVDDLTAKAMGVARHKMHLLSPEKAFTAVGIMLDKWLLFHDQPNQIQAQVPRSDQNTPPGFDAKRLNPDEVRQYLELVDKACGVPALRMASDLNNPVFSDPDAERAYLEEKAAAEKWKICPGCERFEIHPDLELCSSCRKLLEDSSRGD